MAVFGSFKRHLSEAPIVVKVDLLKLCQNHKHETFPNSYCLRVFIELYLH